MSKNLATRFGNLSLGQLPVLSRKANPDREKGSTDDTSTQFGGVAFSLWHNSGTYAISNFEAAWTVPSDPKDDDEEYHIYNSLSWTLLDDGGNPAISANLRPVLRWAKPETGGKACWTVSSWYIGQNSTCSTTPVKVTAGSTITGKIKLTKSDNEYEYKCFFTNSTGEISGTQLYVYGGNAYDTAVVGFEWANVKTKADFSPSPIAASSILIKTGDTNPTVVWKLSTFQTTGDGGPVTVQVKDASSTAGQVQFNLPS